GAVLLGAGGAFVAYLLARFPYDGLYGQDSYAYYYQAVAFWQELTGQASSPGQPFTTSGLYHWPIGYHLHLLLGFLIAGVRPAGGRALTLGMTVATSVLVYALVGALWRGGGTRARIVAGLIAGGLLLLTGTYVRMGVS